MDKVFRLTAQATALGNRKGQVKVYSVIGPYRWDDDDPTVTSNDFIKALDEMDVDEITVRINSPGGVVTEAVAIRTALMKHPAKKTVDIEGACDSAATIIACLPGARVRMAKGGEYMIHRCSCGAWGNADKLLSAYNSATQTDKDLADIYAERTGMTPEECMALMEKETWYGAKEAMEAGFVDEIINGAEDGEFEMVACAVSPEADALMKRCYQHAPMHRITAASDDEGSRVTVSNENTAVAAVSSTENTNEGVNGMELKDATAEMLRSENPNLAASIAQEAIEAERERVKEITALTRKGEKWEKMSKKAIAEGTSAADFLKQIIAEETRTGEEYLENRKQETKVTENIGGGDSGDHDGDVTEMVTRAAKEIAEMAKDIAADSLEMA